MAGDKRETLKENPEASVRRNLAAGTIIKIGGFPFKLEQDAVVSGHPANFAHAAESVVFPEFGQMRQFVPGAIAGGSLRSGTAQEPEYNFNVQG